MRYIDRFEIEVKIGRIWTFIGNVYPKYQWKIVRPWYFMWLVKVPVIVDYVNDALIGRLDAIVAAGEFAYTVRPHTPARVWQIERRGRRYVKKFVTWETP